MFETIYPGIDRNFLYYHLAHPDHSQKVNKNFLRFFLSLKHLIDALILTYILMCNFMLVFGCSLLYCHKASG